MTDFSYSVSSTSKGQINTAWPKIPTIIHTAGINYLVWSMVPRYTKTHSKQHIPRAYTFFPGAGQDQSFL